MKHELIITPRQQIAAEWLREKPQRSAYRSWDDWMAERSLWTIDMAHALERFDRRERWVREGTFA